jgi:hypothetical protein
MLSFGGDIIIIYARVNTAAKNPSVLCCAGVSRRNCPLLTSNGTAKSRGGDSTRHPAPTSLSKNCSICFSFSSGKREQVTYTRRPPTLTRRDARCKICCCSGNRLARRSIPLLNPASNVPHVLLASGFLLQDPTLQQMHV